MAPHSSVDTNVTRCSRWPTHQVLHTSERTSLTDAYHTAVAGPYNKIQNWDYVKFIESMDNGNDQSWAVRVCAACGDSCCGYCTRIRLCTAWCGYYFIFKTFSGLCSR